MGCRTVYTAVRCSAAALLIGSLLVFGACSSGVSVQANSEDTDLFHQRPQEAPGGQRETVENMVRPRVTRRVATVLPESYVITQERFVMVEVLVAENGKVTQARLLQPSEDDVLNQAAIEAAPVLLSPGDSTRDDTLGG